MGTIQKKAGKFAATAFLSITRFLRKEVEAALKFYTDVPERPDLEAAQEAR